MGELTFIALSIIYFVLIVFIIIPICTALHEFGHALPLLLFTRDEVTVVVGNKPAQIQFKTGRLNMEFRLVGSSSGYVYSSESMIDKSKSLRFWTYAGGPIISFIIVFVSFYCVLNYSLLTPVFILVRAAGIYAFFQMLVTVIPMYYPKWWPQKHFVNWPSDGMRIVNLFRKSSRLEN